MLQQLKKATKKETKICYVANNNGDGNWSDQIKLEFEANI